MSNQFFEGKDFQGEKFKPLMPEFYPLKYQEYIKQETQLLREKIASSDKILEAGVGIGRLIPILAPEAGEFIGIDIADLMLSEAKKIAQNYNNVQIKKLAIEDLSKNFNSDYFDFSLCLWNTLGNVTDEIAALKQLSIVTNRNIFISVYKKGTLEDRKNWYKTVGIKIENIDEDNEIFYSESGLRSKSYSEEDLDNLAKQSELRIKEKKTLAGVMLWVELVR